MATARWLSQHTKVEIVSRDRCGLYAEGTRRGAPQARQVADRFHLIQNLRQTIEQQLSRASPRRRMPVPGSGRRPRTAAGIGKASAAFSRRPPYRAEGHV
jgi:transposase